MAELQKNQLHTLTIDGYTAEGLGGGVAGYFTICYVVRSGKTEA